MLTLQTIFNAAVCFLSSPERAVQDGGTLCYYRMPGGNNRCNNQRCIVGRFIRDIDYHPTMEEAGGLTRAWHRYNNVWPVNLKHQNENDVGSVLLVEALQTSLGGYLTDELVEFFGTLQMIHDQTTEYNISTSSPVKSTLSGRDLQKYRTKLHLNNVAIAYKLDSTLIDTLL